MAALKEVYAYLFIDLDSKHSITFLAFPGVGVDGFYVLLYSIALIEPFSCQPSVCPNTSHLYACKDLFNWSVPMSNLPKRR